MGVCDTDSMNPSFMKEAIRLAMDGQRDGSGGPFGAVVVKSDVIVGRGWNQVVAGKDPTAHAEVLAIRAACQNLGTHDLSGCDLYTSCEPCPMCLGAIYWAHLERVWFAASRQDAAAAGFDDEFIYAEFARPNDERRLRLQSYARGDGLKAFELWQANPGKIPY